MLVLDSVDDCFWYPEFGKKIHMEKQKLKGVDDLRRCTADTCGDTDNRIALHFAAKFCSEKCAKFLIDAGSNIDHPDKGGQTPLHVSINQRSCPVMKLLIEKGANYETGRGSEGAARRVMFACEASKKSG